MYNVLDASNCNNSLDVAPQNVGLRIGYSNPMQTFKNKQDAQLKVWPASLQEWEVKPEIKFTVAHDRIVHPGDRIHAVTKMRTTGPNSGGIVDVYYYITEIIEVQPNRVHISETDITATAKRVEV